MLPWLQTRSLARATRSGADRRDRGRHTDAVLGAGVLGGGAGAVVAAPGRLGADVARAEGAAAALAAQHDGVRTVCLVALVAGWRRLLGGQGLPALLARVLERADGDRPEQEQDHGG